MGRIFINQIEENDRIDAIFLVSSKNMGTTKAGSPFISLKLRDRTGEIDAKIWDDAQNLNKIFNQGDFVRIRAKTVTYQNQLQLQINNINLVKKEDVNLEDFLPCTDKDIESMANELKEIASEIKEKHLKELVFLFLNDPIFFDKFCHAPAAKGLHHYFIGGLLEHTLSVVKLILLISKHYDFLDKDLLITGGILHDIGKIKELHYEKDFDYTTEGRLIGHIFIGLNMIENKIKKIEGFPEDIAIQLKHLIISHHGMREFGSPKRPKTLEAILLHYIDDLDAKIEGIRSFIKENRNDDTGWTSFNKIFERFFFSPEG
ncbi:MAG: HD family phosphohydrolase [Deltaproteobacteria bacterium]|nr:MAG: HD family phosphohydrolase [Deltaproteobacteria bacterium]